MAFEHHWSKDITLGAVTSKKKRWISTGNKLGWLLIDLPSYYKDKQLNSILKTIKQERKFSVFLKISMYVRISNKEKSHQGLLGFIQG